MKTPVFAIAASVFFCAAGAAQNPNREVHLINSIQGPDLYNEYCAVCHGLDARGGGPVAKTLKVPPPDLTRLAAHNGGKFPSSRIFGIIGGSAPALRGHGTHEMPIWGPIFSEVTRDQDLGQVRIDNLVRYLESIQRK
jgi:mono/diheme cytochrome c family protein